MKTAQIDCVVVGYNDPDFSDMLARTELSKKCSGAYQHLLANSASFRGRRIGYAELFNLALEEASGRPQGLHVGKLPNLGACYLVSFLRRRSFQVELVNYFNDSKSQFAEILEQHPLSVAITTTFYYQPEPIKQIVEFVRQHSPETTVIVGGPHIFNICTDYGITAQDALLADIGADIYVFDSQGEATLSRVCSALRQPQLELNRIPNLVFAEGGGRFHRTERQAEANDMDAEAVDWSLFDPQFLAPTVQTRTARSCAYKCSFCRYPVIGGPLNLTSLDVIEREMKYLRSIGVTRLLFVDDTFNIPMNRFKEICRMMIRNNFQFEWFSYFRCANADAECFQLLSDSGCAGVFLGIESGDNSVLKAMNKIASVEKYSRGIEWLNDRGIVSYASFIIGHPGETEESAQNTIAFIEKCKPTFYCLETFFYDPKVPIAGRAPEFKLSGGGYSWKHEGMDWRRASSLVQEGYRKITGSVVCPLYGFDLWSLAYLMGKGISLNSIREFLRVASKMMISSEPKTVGPKLDEELVYSLRASAHADPLTRLPKVIVP